MATLAGRSFLADRHFRSILIQMDCTGRSRDGHSSPRLCRHDRLGAHFDQTGVPKRQSTARHTYIHTEMDEVRRTYRAFLAVRFGILYGLLRRLDGRYISRRHPYF